MGIDLFKKDGHTGCNKYTVLFLLILLTSLAWYIIYIIIVKMSDLGHVTSIGFLSTPVLVDSAWFILYRNRFQLKCIFSRLSDNFEHHPTRCFLQLLQFSALFALLFIFPAIVAAIYMLSLLEYSPCDRFYTMSYTSEDLGITWHLVFVVFSAYVTQITKTNFLCLVGMVYCSLCYRCCLKISVVKHKLSTVERSKSNSELLNTLKYYQKIQKTIIMLDDAFSPVMLISVIVNFLSIFTGLSVVFFSNLNVYKALDITLVIIFNILNLVTNVAFAAEVPQQIREVNLKLCEMNENMSFSPNWMNAKPSIEALLQREVTVLSACSILYFNRGFILASVGSLLTYGLLVKQFGH